MESVYSFNNTDYEFVVRLFNGVHDIYLKAEGWSNLYIEEDIFEWTVKGSIDINASYEAFERESDTAVSKFGDKTKMVYKFRNDGRDTLYLYILPKSNVPTNPNVPLQSLGNFEHQIWGIELEATIYDVKDWQSSNITSKMKTLYFWEKTYQMMTEKNVEFTTANVGANKGKANIYKLSDDERSLKTGDAIGELLKNDEDFSKHAELVGGTEWNKGTDKNKILYTSPSNYKFIDDLNYLLDEHTSDESEKYQPCIFKFERSPAKGMPKQFTLKSIKEYFTKAGKDAPGDYQIEHLVFEEYSQEHGGNVPIPKVPQHLEPSGDLNNNITAEDYSTVKNYKIVDLSGLDNSARLYNRFITSHNSKKGQFNIEIKEHKTEKFKEFYEETISPNIMTEDSKDRLPLTPYIQKGYNSKYHYSIRNTEESRIPDGRNKLLKYYLFSNLGITFSLRGLTIRQPGRFVGLARNTKNDKEYDHKLEGQYFVTNVVHCFDNTARSYFTQVVGVKVHTFREETKLPEDDVMILGGDTPLINDSSTNPRSIQDTFGPASTFDRMS